MLDPFTIKPLDEAAIVKHARAVQGRVVVVEDHYQAGKLLLFNLAIRICGNLTLKERLYVVSNYLSSTEQFVLLNTLLKLD